tara:strand:+ start:1777 stop:2097 length:321 start_codon:yes stop_codon:yes gene_type:complete
MKNANRPAMPQPMVDHEGEVYTTFDSSYGKQSGLTKREMFAMHAPDMPDWFCDKWFSDNEDQYVPEYCEKGNVVAGLKRTRLVSFEGTMKMMKDWRYAYADMMLSE